MLIYTVFGFEYYQKWMSTMAKFWCYITNIDHLGWEHFLNLPLGKNSFLEILIMPACSSTLSIRSFKSGALERVLHDPTMISFFFARVIATLILCQSPRMVELPSLWISEDLTKETMMHSLSLPYHQPELNEWGQLPKTCITEKITWISFKQNLVFINCVYLDEWTNNLMYEACLRVVWCNDANRITSNASIHQSFYNLVSIQVRIIMIQLSCLSPEYIHKRRRYTASKMTKIWDLVPPLWLLLQLGYWRSCVLSLQSPATCLFYTYWKWLFHWIKMPSR